MLFTDSAIQPPKSKPTSLMVYISPLHFSILRESDDLSGQVIDFRFVFSVIRACVPKLNLDDVFEQKNEIAKSVEEELDKAMTAYGYEILQTLIIDIEPDQQVKRAMNEINAGKSSKS